MSSPSQSALIPSVQLHQKLVRDDIPAIISSDGRVPVTRILNNEEFVAALLAKLHEEVDELTVAVTDDEQVGELGDVFEVLYATAKALGHRSVDVDQARFAKLSNRGGFAGRTWLESSTERCDETTAAAA